VGQGRDLDRRHARVPAACLGVGGAALGRGLELLRAEQTGDDDLDVGVEGDARPDVVLDRAQRAPHGFAGRRPVLLERDAGGGDRIARGLREEPRRHRVGVVEDPVA
jgi:hypothetical protein